MFGLTSSRIADYAHKAVGLTLIAFTVVGTANFVSMIAFKVRVAKKADRLLAEETSHFEATCTEPGTIPRLRVMSWDEGARC
eukprot:jgi/Hompol1/1689/HPOL_001421-RA